MLKQCYVVTLKLIKLIAKCTTWVKDTLETCTIFFQGYARKVDQMGSVALVDLTSRLRRVQEMPYLTRSSLHFINKGIYLDGSKAKRELGWEPKVSLEEGTRLYIK